MHIIVVPFYVYNFIQKQFSRMPKDSIKDKLNGNELDLSLSDMEVIPVKELVCLPCEQNTIYYRSQFSIWPLPVNCKMLYKVNCIGVVGDVCRCMCALAEVSQLFKTKPMGTSAVALLMKLV